MILEPKVKRAIAFVDGQNLFYAVKSAFGFSYPNYDVLKLCRLICAERGWELLRTNFYTGIPEFSDDPKWNQFWQNKLAMMGYQGIRTFSRHLRYRNQTIKLPDGTEHVFMVGQEKGIDVRIAIDTIRCVHRNECDVVLIFSQDQDLSEVAEEIRLIAKEQNRWVKIASAFPTSPTAPNRRGIEKTDWIRFDRNLYESCIDPKDYRPGKAPR